MLQKISFCFVGGLAAGFMLSLPFWFVLIPKLPAMYVNNKNTVDQTITASIIESSISNPEVQNILKKQILLYLKSPEGKVALAETFKTPEMTKAMSENIQTPEMVTAIHTILANPEFSHEILQSIKETPEGKALTLLTTMIQWNQPETDNDAKQN